MDNSIIKFYDLYFPLDKIRQDLFSYLDEMMTESKRENEYIFEVFEIDSQELTKEVRISKTDLLTPYIIKSSYEFQTDLYYYVTIGIGKFKTRDEFGFYKIEKCNATLKYNFDFSLYDVEFSYSQMTEMNKVANNT
tara:strand:+ start:776 stop:1183 length:408 start_codon:yes stop_codon:yes gene_type:complete